MRILCVFHQRTLRLARRPESRAWLRVVGQGLGLQGGREGLAEDEVTLLPLREMRSRDRSTISTNIVPIVS